MEQENQRPKVGVGIMIFKEGKVLMQKRKNSHGSGEYAFPGGHLEHMESFETCAKRETKEECGIEITNVRFNCVGNVTAYTPKHYVDIELIADWESCEPQVLEPEKSDGWDWYDLDHLPEPMFAMCAMAFKAYKEKQNYFDAE